MRRLVATLLAILSAGAALAACGGTERADSGSPTGADGPEMTKLTVATLPILDVAPLHIAIKDGYFKREGLVVTTQPVQGGAAAIPAMLNGEFDIVFGNNVSFLLGISKGLPLRLITQANIATPGDTAVLAPKGSDIQSPADLRGKKIAVNTLNNIATLTAEVELQDQGVDPDSVTFVELPLSQTPAALNEGRVDAAWVPEPFTTRIEQDGARVALEVFSKPARGVHLAGYATTDQFAEGNPQTVAAFQRALEAATRSAAKNPDRVREIVPTYTEIPAELAEKATLPTYFAGQENPRLQRLADFMLEFGYLKDKLDVREVTRN